MVVKRSDNFMRDEIRPSRTAPAVNSLQLTYWDGLRFGFGFLIANLLGLAVVGGVAFGIAALLHLT